MFSLVRLGHTRKSAMLPLESVRNIKHVYRAVSSVSSTTIRQQAYTHTRTNVRTITSNTHVDEKYTTDAAHHAHKDERHSVTLNPGSRIPKLHSEPPQPSTKPDVVSLLELERLDTCLYRSLHVDKLWQPPGSKGMYGGQIVGQAVTAARETLYEDTASTDRPAPELNSMHAYFLKPGNASMPVLFTVTTLLAGRSFQSYSVIASQNGVPVLHLQCSFHHREDSPLYYHKPMANVPSPESLTPMKELRHKASMDDRLPLKMRQYFKTNQSNFPLDTRIVGLDYEEFIREGNRPSSTLSELKIPKKLVWMRALGELGDDPQIHKCVAAWASDWGVGVTPMKAVGSSFVSPEVRMCCSLDHAMWFNGDFRADEWMLYEMEGIQFAGGRGVSSGRIYDQEGNMKVHVTQEILIRYKPGTEYPKFDKTLQW